MFVQRLALFISIGALSSVVANADNGERINVELICNGDVQPIFSDTSALTEYETQKKLFEGMLGFSFMPSGEELLAEGLKEGFGGKSSFSQHFVINDNKLGFDDTPAGKGMQLTISETRIEFDKNTTEQFVREIPTVSEIHGGLSRLTGSFEINLILDEAARDPKIPVSGLRIAGSCSKYDPKKKLF